MLGEDASWTCPLIGLGILISVVVIALLVEYLQDSERNRRKSAVLRLLRDSLPQGFHVTDEHFGEDERVAILMDRHRRQLLVWQGSLEKTFLYPASAVRTVEYCENGVTITSGVGVAVGGVGIGVAESERDVRTIHLRLELADVDNPYVAVCFLNCTSPVNNAFYRATAERARAWKARLEAMKQPH